MSRGGEDPRLQRALQLLAEVMQETSSADSLGSPLGAPSLGAPSLGPLFQGPPGDDPRQHAYQVWLTSATDLLVPWSPEAAAGIPSAPSGWSSAGVASEATSEATWQRYFGQHAAASAAAGIPETTGKQPIQLPIDALTLGQAVTDEVDDLAAEAAVDALYEFVHALGRRDVAAAMDLVAEDFHVLADDAEVDRRALRQQIEAFLEDRQHELEIHLSRVPEPVAHAMGILLEMTLHADHTVAGELPQTELPQTTVVSAVVLMTLQDEGDWQIASLVTLDSLSPPETAS